MTNQSIDAEHKSPAELCVALWDDFVVRTCSGNFIRLISSCRCCWLPWCFLLAFFLMDKTISLSYNKQEVLIKTFEVQKFVAYLSGLPTFQIDLVKLVNVMSNQGLWLRLQRGQFQRRQKICFSLVKWHAWLVRGELDFPFNETHLLIIKDSRNSKREEMKQAGLRQRNQVWHGAQRFGGSPGLNAGVWGVLTDYGEGNIGHQDRQDWVRATVTNKCIWTFLNSLRFVKHLDTYCYSVFFIFIWRMTPLSALPLRSCVDQLISLNRPFFETKTTLAVNSLDGFCLSGVVPCQSLTGGISFLLNGAGTVSCAMQKWGLYTDDSPIWQMSVSLNMTLHLMGPTVRHGGESVMV